jgi:predicted acetyltransferase
MMIEVIPALISDKPVIQRMMELFRHDLSEFENTDLDEHGYFGYSYLDYYWVEADRCPFIVRVDSKLAGFVLINQHTYFPDNQYSVAEFFILRKYRRRGVGREVAFYVFNLFFGRWEISQLYINVIAQKFWNETIRSYTADNYTKEIVETDRGGKIFWSFDNSNKIAQVRSTPIS